RHRLSQARGVMQFAHHEFHALAAHALLQLDDMARCGIHTRTDLNRADWLHPEALGKVDHIRMVADKLPATQRCSLTLPTGNSGVQCLEVHCEILLEDGRVLWIVACQAVGDGPGHRLATDWIKVKMWVSHGVHVTQCAVEACRHFEWGDVDRAV